MQFFGVSIDLIVSVLALLLSIYGLALAFSQDKKLRDQLLKMSEIAASVPTRASASYKDHVHYIAGLVRGATPGAQIKIINDCADYGSFFDPANHKALLDELLAARSRGVNVRLIVGGPLQHITQTSQFNGQSFTSLLKRTAFQEHFHAYLNHLRAEAAQLGEKSFKSWLQALAESEAASEGFMQWLLDNRANRDGEEVNRAMHHLALKASILECQKIFSDSGSGLKSGDDSTFQMLLFARERYFEEILVSHGIGVQRRLQFNPMLFFWLRTDSYSEEAAFMFAESERDALGATMTTVDPHFIKLFDGIFDREWQPQPVLSRV